LAYRQRVIRGLFLVNDVLAFFVEVWALGILVYWGIAVGDGAVAQAGLAVGAVLAAAVLWGLFAAPRARFKIPLAGQLAVKAVVFGAAAAALFGTGHPVHGTVFAIVVVLNTALATLGRGRGLTFAPAERRDTG
jgi:hypothetical protein